MTYKELFNQTFNKKGATSSGDMALWGIALAIMSLVEILEKESK